MYSFSNKRDRTQLAVGVSKPYTYILGGEQKGLRGQLMKILLDDLAPEAKLRLYAETGQEYFDEWAKGAVEVLEQHDMEWIKENQPAMWIYLQMVE